MNIDTKRDELSNWVLNLDEEMLQKIDELKNNDSKKNVIYNSQGKGLTKEEYVHHVEEISNSINNGAKTFTPKEVREYVLNRKS
ncbi:hypothetical protein [Polaribacter vadi]|uniref:hypothetical protein n=1 Tax=Polaribacter vadi TaxID=1774273 RepID=UPI0030EF4CC1|tara:strand:- start:430 stop:681 length:252 start_codon:yes stop_codon:yes gene_type:complete